MADTPFRIYKWRFSTEFQWLCPTSESDIHIWRREFEAGSADPFSRAVAESEVQRCWDMAKLPLGDNPGFLSGIHVVSSRLADIVQRLCGDSVDLLQINFPEAQLFALRSGVNVDAIDYERSELEMFESGNIDRVHRLVLQDDRVPDVPVYSLQALPQSVFVKQEFIDACRSKEIVGPRFVEIPTDGSVP